MPSLTRKLIKGRPYYYVRHCQRVDGRPKIVKTTYLGSLEHILQTVQSAQTPLAPQQAEISSLGDVAALFDLATQLAGVYRLGSEKLGSRAIWRAFGGCRECMTYRRW